MQNLKNYINDYEVAINKRMPWEDHWKECLKYVRPEAQRIFDNNIAIGGKSNSHIFDSTAQNAVENLASNLTSSITPSWTKWFSLQLNKSLDINQDEKAEILKSIGKIEDVLEYNFNMSNFAIQMHQFYLDLVSIGTACIMFEEAQIGQQSAFTFKSVPLSQITIDEGDNGLVEKVFRRTTVTLDFIKEKYPECVDKINASKLKDDLTFIQCVTPRYTSTGKQGFNFVSFIENPSYNSGKKSDEKYIYLQQSVLQYNPFICARWSKSTNEVYGISPVMKVLPDIKTVNKVVELVLQNATIAISGVWQADDDGVINLDNIELKPGTIIPKAVGSNGLMPLQTGASFDVSHLVLSDLRANINKAFLTQELGDLNANLNMSATEVLQRMQASSKLLSSVYSRLQSELLSPVITQAISILKRRGLIDNIVVNGDVLNLKFQSPIANIQMRQDAENLISWIKYISALGMDIKQNIDASKVSSYLANSLGIKEDIYN